MKKIGIWVDGGLVLVGIILFIAGLISKNEYVGFIGILMVLINIFRFIKEIKSLKTG